MEYLGQIASDFARQLSATNDALVATQHTNAQLQATVLDMKSVAKTNEALLMQATTQNVNRVQFQQTIDKLSHRVLQLEAALGLQVSEGPSATTVGPQAGVAKVVGSPTSTTHSLSSQLKPAGVHAPAGGSGGEVANRLAQICKEEIARWAENSAIETRIDEAKEGVKTIREYLPSQLAKLDALGPMISTVSQISQSLEDRVTISFFNAANLQIQGELQKGKDEAATLRRTVASHSQEMNEIGVRLQDLLFRASEFTNKRIGLMYNTLCIEENTDELDVEMPEPAALSPSMKSAAHSTFASSLNGSGGSQSSSDSVKQPARPTFDLPPAPASSSTLSSPLQKGGRKSESGAALGRSARRSEAKPLSEEESITKQQNLLQSPMFLLFRQAILSDIADRVTSTYSSQSSDFGSEVVALRADIRQRATAQRVVELIKQHEDLETPKNVVGLTKRIAQVEETLVTNSFFTEALKTKTDTKVTELKADKADLAQVTAALQAELSALSAKVMALDDEREDLRAVARELESQVKRDAALKRLFPDGLRAAGAGGTSSSMGSTNPKLFAEPEAIVSGSHRLAVQPFLPAIVKLVPIEESLVSKYLPTTAKSGGDDGAEPGDGTPPPMLDNRQTVSSSRATSKTSRLSSNNANTAAVGSTSRAQTSKTTTGGPPAAIVTIAVPHAPHVGTGNQTPVSRHNAALGVSASETKVKATSMTQNPTAAKAPSLTTTATTMRTDNQEAYAKILENSDRTKAKTHPAIPYDL
jgi:hypothetical protein